MEEGGEFKVGLDRVVLYITMKEVTHVMLSYYAFIDENSCCLFL